MSEYPGVLKNRLLTLLGFDAGCVVLSILIMILSIKAGRANIALIIALVATTAVLIIVTAKYKKSLDENDYLSITGVITFIERSRLAVNDSGRPTAYHIKANDGQTYNIEIQKHGLRLPIGTKIIFYCPSNVMFIESKGILLVDACWGYQVLEEPGEIPETDLTVQGQDE